jgi:hypothetical protein
MGYQILTSFRTLMLLVTFWGVAVCDAAPPTSAAAKAGAKNASAAKSFIPPKTPWGDPDIQGLWPGSFAIPIQRDPKFGNRAALTDEELAVKQKENLDRQELDLGGGDVLTGKEVIDVNSPTYWSEYQDPNRQTSLIVDPPDGRLPPLTPEGQKRKAAVRDADRTGQWNSWEDTSLYQRCITRGLVGSMMSSLYDNGNQILQEPGYVVVRNEMIHEARVIPLDGRPHPSQDVLLYMGDGRGHWEGNTLVVETTNLNGRPSLGENFYNGPPTGDKTLRLVEKFTRTAPDRLDYEITITDPSTWTRSWTIHYPYKADPTYTLQEYACHEANYGLINILAGARAADKAKESK